MWKLTQHSTIKMNVYRIWNAIQLYNIRNWQYFNSQLDLEQWFEDNLKEKKGFVLKKMREDGACLFRAVGMLETF